MNFDERKGCARLVGEDIYGHVEARVIGQEHLQARVFVAEERLALDVALVADEDSWFVVAGNRDEFLFENQELGSSIGLREMEIGLAWDVSVATGPEVVLFAGQIRNAFSFEDVNEELVRGGVAAAFAVFVESNLDLGEVSAHAGGNLDDGDDVAPAGKDAWDEAAGRAQGVAIFYDVAGLAEERSH